VAPYEFLLIGAVVLAASASSTTGAWYSITLKEMKEKFEGMGLSLTSKLLKADMTANSLSMYAGIGFAHRLIAYPAIMEFVQDPNEVTFAKALTFVLVSGLLHNKIGGILRDKENASVQFDYNDATLAGMTEEQQKFFAEAISDVRKELDGVKNLDSGVNYNHTVYRCVNALTFMVQGCDIHERHQNVFDEIKQLGNGLAENYESNLEPFAEYFLQVVTRLIDVLDFEEGVKMLLKSQLKQLDASDNQEGSHQKLSAIAANVIPVITKFLQEKGEKGVAKEEVEPN
jgi:hypothetical protein